MLKTASYDKLHNICQNENKGYASKNYDRLRDKSVSYFLVCDFTYVIKQALKVLG